MLYEVITDVGCLKQFTAVTRWIAVSQIVAIDNNHIGTFDELVCCFFASRLFALPINRVKTDAH